jgi:hypothetical protein
LVLCNLEPLVFETVEVSGLTKHLAIYPLAAGSVQRNNVRGPEQMA